MTTTVYTDGGLRRSPGFRKNPVVLQEPGRRLRARVAETAGEKAAECAGVCCCFPVGLVNLLVVVTVKLPAGLVRRAVRQHRIKQRRNKSPLLLAKPRSSDANPEDEFGVCRLSSDDDAWPEMSPEKEVLELEKVMWASFYNTGFWRSPSQSDELVKFVPMPAVEEEDKC